MTEAEFNFLADDWELATGWSSMVSEKERYPSFQLIEAAGPVVIPFVLRRMQRKLGHWFGLLHRLTLVNDLIPPGDRGYIQRMTNHWLAWGQRNGLLTPWRNPIDLKLVPTEESESFKAMEVGETGLPMSPHPGAFGVQRQHHIHEGVDLYCPAGTVVRAVEPGVVVAIEAFTGPQVGTPWWNDTWAALVEGPTGVVLYGEINPYHLTPGAELQAGDPVGDVVTVLTKDKGRPMSMLHLELHAPRTRESAHPWTDKRPRTLLDPTPHLLAIKS